MKVQRYKCRNCDFDQQERIPFATGSRSYTHRFAKYVVDLLRGMTLQDVSNHLGVSWDTVKEIHSTYLERHYSLPSLDGVENIGIDEFAVRKGNVYKTIVVDFDSGRVLYVGDGKGADALAKFWRKVKRKGVENFIGDSRADAWKLFLKENKIKWKKEDSLRLVLNFLSL